MKKFPDNNSINILLIEDSKPQTEFIRAVLNSGMIENFQLQCADTLANGLNLLSTNNIDIILLDLNLPDSEKMDTFLRVHKEVPHLPIIIMSGIDDNAFAHKAVQMGAQDYLVKGKIDTHNLSRSIHYALERKRIEDALIESKEQWRSLIENSPDIILNVDQDGKIKFINRVLPGQPTQEQTIGMNVIDFVPPEHHKRHEEAFRYVFETGKEKGYESKAVGPNGSTSWYICRVVPIKHDDQVLSINLIVTDITERKKTETALKDSEQLFRSITTSAQDAIIMIDNNGNVSFWNSAAEKIFGYTQDEIFGQELHKIVVPEKFYNVYKKGFARFKKTGIGIATGRLIELTGRRKDGTEFPLELSLSSIKLKEKWCAIGILRDITERKQAEEQAMKFKTIAEKANYGVVIVDIEGNVEYVNEYFANIHGYEIDELLGKNLSIFHNEEQMKDVTEINKKLIEEGSYYLKKVWHIHKDGAVFPMLMNGIFINDKNKNHQFIAATAVDITEMVKNEKMLKNVNNALKAANDNIIQTQAKMLQQEKLASIGHLAAGVAHELNNPLGFVANNIDTLKRFIKKVKEYISSIDDFIIECQHNKKSNIEGCINNIKSIKKKNNINFILEDIDELFDESATGFERVTSIIQSLRNFSRVDFIDEVGSYDLNNAIEDTLIVTANEINSIVAIEKNFSDNPLIECKGSEINLVLLNIIINAAHAIESLERPDSGKIVIDTYNDNEYVFCKISDNGPGIPKSDLSKVFDPFFTTKEEGKGVGLGLHTSYDIIVNKHKGELTVENQVGKGATFIIKLPIHHQTSNKELDHVIK